MKLRALLAIATLLGTLALGSGLEVSAADSRPEVGCGVQTITTDAVLRHDLDCHNGWLAIGNSASSPITVDLQGHTWRTDVPSSNIDPLEISGNVIIKNGTLIVAGTHISNAKTDRGITFTKVHVIGNVSTYSLAYSSVNLLNSRIDGTLINNGSATIANSRVADGFYSFILQVGTFPINITNSLIEGGASIVPGFGADFCGCSAQITGTIAYSTFSNSARFDGNGLSIYGASLYAPMTLNLVGNHFLDNAGDGLNIKSTAGNTVTLKGNVARRNGGAGILVTSPSIIDAGGNRARGNAVSPQCVGVSC